MKTLNRKEFPGAQYPTRVIQFGEGNFLRAFIDKKTGERTGKVEALRSGRGGIAPRPFLFLEVEKVDQIRDQLIAYVERALKEPHNVAR